MNRSVKLLIVLLIAANCKAVVNQTKAQPTENPRFFYLLCLQNLYDDLRPIFLVMPTTELKVLIENKVKKHPSSWKDDKAYGYHLSPSQLHETEWSNFKNRFDLIYQALGIKPPEMEKETIASLHFAADSEKQDLIDWLEEAQSKLPEEKEPVDSILQRLKDSIKNAQASYLKVEKS